MKRVAILGSLILLLALAQTACGSTSAGRPRAWIDRPLDGEQVALEPLTIVAHASDAQGVTQFEFMVDSNLLGAVPANGTRFTEATAGWVPPGPGTYTVRVRAKNGTGNVGEEAISRIVVGELAMPTPTPTPEPALPAGPSGLQITFTTDRDSLKQGDCAILQWQVLGPVESTRLNGQVVDPRGQAQVCPERTMTYALSASTGEPADRRQTDIVIFVEGPSAPECAGLPVITSFFANPNSTIVGQSTVLSWSAIANATSAVIDQGVGEAALSGDTSSPLYLRTTTTFTLTATGCGGTVTKQATVIVNQAPPQPPPPPPVCPGPPVIAFFSANPSTINAGQSSTLSWGPVTNATSAVVDPDVGGVPAPGSASVRPGGTRTYTLTATGCGGTVRKQVTIVVNPAPPPPPPPPPPRDTTAPSVSNVSANPTSLVKDGSGCPRSSRTTTVRATVSDAGGVNRVVARVLGTGIEVTMNAAGGNNYQATVGPFNATGSLSIVVIAWDKAGNSAQGGPVNIQVSPCIQ